MQRNLQRAGDGESPAVAPACKWTAEGVRKERGIFIRKFQPAGRNLWLRSEGMDEGHSLGPSQPILSKHSSISRREAYVSCHGYVCIQWSAQAEKKRRKSELLEAENHQIPKHIPFSSLWIKVAPRLRKFNRPWWNVDRFIRDFFIAAEVYGVWPHKLEFRKTL